MSTHAYVTLDGYVAKPPMYSATQGGTPVMTLEMVEDVKNGPSVWRYVKLYGPRAKRYKDEGLLAQGSEISVVGRERFKLSMRDGEPHMDIFVRAFEELFRVKSYGKNSPRRTEGQGGTPEAASQAAQAAPEVQGAYPGDQEDGELFEGDTLSLKDS